MNPTRENTAGKTLTRRFVLKTFGAGAVVFASGAGLMWSRRAVAGTANPEPKPDATPDATTACFSAHPSDEPAPWWLLAPLTAGSKIGSATLLAVAPENGILNIDVETGGKKLRIRVCKRDDSQGAPTPVARTKRYDFFLANGGKGSKPTDESEGVAVIAVAAVAEKNEGSRAPLPLSDVREYWRRCGG